MEARHLATPVGRRWNVAKGRCRRPIAAASDATGPGHGQDSTSGASRGVPAPDAVLTLARRYHCVQNPALANTLYSKAVEDFTASAVLAYECGHHEADVGEQLGRLPEEELRRLAGFEPAECVAMVCLVWVTLMLSPRSSVKRWATVSAVSEPTLAQWRGFVAMIVDGYFERRMAWFPLDRLALELSAVQGRALAQELVAERARVVYTTLEQVYPQFAKD